MPTGTEGEGGKGQGVLRRSVLTAQVPLVSVVGYTNCGEGPQAAALHLSTGNA